MESSLIQRQISQLSIETTENQIVPTTNASNYFMFNEDNEDYINFIIQPELNDNDKNNGINLNGNNADGEKDNDSENSDVTYTEMPDLIDIDDGDCIINHNYTYNETTNFDIDEICNELLIDYYDKIMILRIFIDTDDYILSNKYDEEIEKHNMKTMDTDYPNSGFQLFLPEEIDDTIDSGQSRNINIDFCIKCSATIYTENWKRYNTGYYLYPSPSIFENPSVQIIDSGYRNNIQSFYEYDNTYNYVKKYSKIAQICDPSLLPIYVVRVSSIYELF